MHDTPQCTVNSTFSLNCIVQRSVTTTEGFSLKMAQQGRNMSECVIIDEKKLFVHLLVFKVFCAMLPWWKNMEAYKPMLRMFE
jgi:hypothetical protein